MQPAHLPGSHSKALVASLLAGAHGAHMPSDGDLQLIIIGWMLQATMVERHQHFSPNTMPTLAATRDSSKPCVTPTLIHPNFQWTCCQLSHVPFLQEYKKTVVLCPIVCPTMLLSKHAVLLLSNRPSSQLSKVERTGDSTTLFPDSARLCHLIVHGACITSTKHAPPDVT